MFKGLQFSFAIFLIFFVSSVALAEPPKKTHFFAGPIGLCGPTLTWNFLLGGLSDEEAQCLDEQAPFAVREVLEGQSKGSHNFEGRWEESGIFTLERAAIVDLLKNAKAPCLKKAELRIPESLSFQKQSVFQKQTLENWVLGQINGIYPLDRIQLRESLRLPNNKSKAGLACEDTVMTQVNNFSLKGNQQFEFTFSVNGIENLITGTYRRFQAIPVAHQFLPGGKKIEEGDLIFKEVDVTFKSDWILQPEKIIGARTLFSANQGEGFIEKNLKRDPLVEKGQIIQVQYKGLDFDLSLSAQAEQSGGLGQLIKIKNLESLKIISGVVMGKNLVEVQ